MHTRDMTAVVQSFFSHTSNSYDRVVRTLTFGFDGRWKRRMLKMIASQAPSRVLDLACGTGIFTFMIARRYPQAAIVGVDITEEYLQVAEQKARDLGLDRVVLLKGRAEEICLGGGFDCITSSYLAKYVDLGRLIHHASAMLNKNGMILLHDFHYPENRSMARLWEFYLKALQRVGILFYPEWKNAFQGLPGLLKESRWTTDAVRALMENGFTDIKRECLTFGTAAIVSGRNSRS